MSVATATAREEPHADHSSGTSARFPRSSVIVCEVRDLHADAGLIGAGARFAARLDAELLLVNVLPVPLVAAEPQIAFASSRPAPACELREAARRLARAAADAGAGDDTRIHVGFGDPRESLVEIAASEEEAILMVGSRRFSKRPLGLFRSPVLVVDDAVVALRAADGELTGSVLCGVDGSTEARLALRTAAQLAAQLGARLVVAHVVEMPPQFSFLGPKTMVPIGAALEAGVRMLERLLEEEGIADADPRVEYGFAPDRLADLADEEDAEVIVVGSRARGAFRAAVLGSVSAAVIGVARCPVLVVPPGTGGAAAVARWGDGPGESAVSAP